MDNKINKKLTVNVFSLGWWFYIVLTITLMVLLYNVSKHYDIDTNRKIILYLSIFELIVLRIYKRSLKSVYEKYNYFNELPLYLCNLSTILCIIAAITNNSIIMGFCTTVGVFGALLAIFMPDKYYVNQPFFSRQAVGFYGYHSLLITSCFAFYLMGVYKPNPMDAVWSMPILFVLTFLVHIINSILRKTGLNPTCNYIFTYDPENAILEYLYKLFPVKLLYLLPILLLFGLLGYIFLSILKVLPL